MSWPDRRLLDSFGIDLPIVQAPMAGSVDAEMVIAVARAGGLGSLPCALLDADQVRSEVAKLRAASSAPFNLNFFCHRPPPVDPVREQAWRGRLAVYYAELGVEAGAAPAGRGRAPFDEAMCDLVVELAPRVVSFHFGLPDEPVLARVRATGAKVVSSATTVDEARWLEDRGCDAIIAQGWEAGGHRGHFLRDDVAGQAGTVALVPQVVDAVKVPVIAAGGIADARGVVAALALGAAAVQIGTAYLFCPEAKVAPAHREALRAAKDDTTVVTNVFTGRPARSVENRLVRELGPMSDAVPAFPRASEALAPLRATGKSDFVPLWSGQAAHLGREMPAGELTKALAAEALARLRP